MTNKEDQVDLAEERRQEKDKDGVGAPSAGSAAKGSPEPTSARRKLFGESPDDSSAADGEPQESDPLSGGARGTVRGSRTSSGRAGTRPIGGSSPTP